MRWVTPDGSGVLELRENRIGILKNAIVWLDCKLVSPRYCEKLGFLFSRLGKKFRYIFRMPRNWLRGNSAAWKMEIEWFTNDKAQECRRVSVHGSKAFRRYPESRKHTCQIWFRESRNSTLSRTRSRYHHEPWNHQHWNEQEQRIGELVRVFFLSTVATGCSTCKVHTEERGAEIFSGIPTEQRRWTV